MGRFNEIMEIIGIAGKLVNRRTEKIITKLEFEVRELQFVAFFLSIGVLVLIAVLILSRSIFLLALTLMIFIISEMMLLQRQVLIIITNFLLLLSNSSLIAAGDLFDGVNY